MRRRWKRPIASAATILLATPRIQKPGEMGIFRVLKRHGADGILVRNLAGLAYYAEQGVPAVADFSLNATNELTAQWLIQRGAARVTASYDLNRDQLLEMAAAVPPEWLEVVIHQHMPMFHMEHCVFCAVLSPGRNKTDCGRPCDRHQVQLRDRIGKQHPLRADVGCRNTLYNATPQSAAEVIPQLIAHGLRRLPHRAIGRRRRGRPGRSDRALPRSLGRPDLRPRGLGPASRLQPRGRHPRHAGRAPQPRRDPVAAGTAARSSRSRSPSGTLRSDIICSWLKSLPAEGTYWGASSFSRICRSISSEWARR